MGSLVRRLPSLEVLLIICWFIMMAISASTYGHNLKAVFDTTASVCTTHGLGETFYRAAQPHYWFGLATIVATFVVGIKAFGRLTSRRAWLSDSKWYLLWLSISLLLLIPLKGCS
jgi:uncharacterized protein (DUF983 family)